MSKINVLKAKMKNLNILDKKELIFLLKLSKDESKQFPLWLNDQSLIPKDVLTKLNNLPSKPPFAHKGKSKFKFIDLFAGIGGIRLGFQQEGGECVFTSEWNSKSAATYKTNFGHIPDGDITQIIPKEVPDFDILLGGFPCQAFSNAGLKKGFDDTRGTLFFDVARIIKEKKPSSFLLENVKGLN